MFNEELVEKLRKGSVQVYFDRSQDDLGELIALLAKAFPEDEMKPLGAAYYSAAGDEWCGYSEKIKQKKDMTNLEIAENLREQLQEQWPCASTMLKLYANNEDGVFTDRLINMVDRLLPSEVFYQMAEHEIVSKKIPVILGTQTPKEYFVSSTAPIESLPINMVLFASADNLTGKL